MLEHSAVEAELGQHTDLLHRIAVSQAKLEGATRGTAPINRLVAAVDYARSTGLLRLEGECYRAMAEFATRDGDLPRASHLVYRALGMAIAGGQALQVTACLTSLGAIRRLEGDETGSSEVFDAAAAMGRFQGYVLMVERIERERFRGAPIAALAQFS